MPKHKAAKKEESSDSDSDSGPEDRGPIKKPKSDTKQKASKSDEEEANSWDLGKNRFVKLTEFRGKWFVNIREFYNADGELKPGKKGITLSMEQWQKFKTYVNDIDDAVKKVV